MRGYLLDTCVISELTRAHGSEKVRAWLDTAKAESLYLSVATLAELEQAIAALGGNGKAQKLSAWLREEILPQFESRILDVDRSVAARWGQMLGAARRAGRSLPIIDALLAATALEYELTLLTRNVKDFAALGIPLVNPWQ